MFVEILEIFYGIKFNEYNHKFLHMPTFSTIKQIKRLLNLLKPHR